MTSLPVHGLLGASYGLLFGVVASAAAVALGFAYARSTGRSTPKLLVLWLALSITGALWYAAGLVDATAHSAVRLATGVPVVALLALFGASQGERVAATVPRGVRSGTRATRTLASNALDDVDGTGHVTITASGPVQTVEGHQPLAPDRRRAIERGCWRLPADLPLPELETRLERRLETEYELAAVSASIDPRARATIEAAPRTKAVAASVPDGQRAVSVDGLVPIGLDVGDEVGVRTAGETVDGTVLDVEREPIDDGDDSRPDAAPVADADDPASVAREHGGRGRVTVAVAAADADRVLDAEAPRLVATSHGVAREFEATALLDRAGWTIRRLCPDEEQVTTLAGRADVRVLAASTGEGDRGWTFDPDSVEPGTRAFVALPRSLVPQLFESDSRTEVGA